MDEHPTPWCSFHATLMTSKLLSLKKVFLVLRWDLWKWMVHSTLLEKCFHKLNVQGVLTFSERASILFIVKNFASVHFQNYYRRTQCFLFNIALLIGHMPLGWVFFWLVFTNFWCWQNSFFERFYSAVGANFR